MEDLFFIFLGLIVVVLFVLGPVGFFLSRGLGRRVSELETRLRASEAAARLLESRLIGLSEQSRPAVSPAQATETPAPEANAPAALQPDMNATAPPEQQPAPPPPADDPDLARLRAVAAARAEVASASPQKAAKGWEEMLGARWAVIVGGLALAFGLVLIVRLAIERGFFGPGARVMIGLAVSAALVAAGEWLRRRETAQDTEGAGAEPLEKPVGSVPIPAVLTAAGTVGAFAAIYAAHALYGMIDPSVAFLALGATGIAGMVAAALHGPALAGIGLAGSLATPLLVASSRPNPWPVLVFVAVVAAAAYWLARTRRWLWLALAAAAGGGAWSFLLAAGIHRQGREAEFFAASALCVALQLGMALYVFVWPFRSLSTTRLSKEACVVPAAFALIAVFVLQQGADYGQFGALWLIFAVAIAAVLAFAGSAITPAAALMTAAGAFVALLTRVWPRRLDLPSPGDALETVFLVWIEPSSPLTLAFIAGALALGVFALAAQRLRSLPALPAWAALTHAATAAATPVAVLGLIWLRLSKTPPHYEFALIAAALAALFVAAAAAFKRLPSEEWASPGKLGLGFFATGALASLALGFTIALEGGHLTVALALSALAAAWISLREDIPALRWCVAVAGGIIALRLAWDPRIVGGQLSATPVFNWLLVGYGVPALSFAAAARLLRQETEDLPQQAAEALAILFAALLCFFEIRHALNGGDPFAHSSKLIEYGLHVSVGLAFAAGLTKMTMARRSTVINGASLLFGYGTMAIGALALLFGVNPFLSRVTVDGSKWFNALLLAYALPALLAMILARLSIGRRPEPYRLAAAVSAILYAFSYLNLQTRRVFHADTLYQSVGFKDLEIYTYSAVWLALGLALLAYGIVMRSREARIGSAALVVAATLKVFVFDVAGLDGALRAFSFIGLGLVLIGIGFVYQKVLFGKPAAASAPPPE